MLKILKRLVNWGGWAICGRCSGSGEDSQGFTCEKCNGSGQVPA